MVIHIYGDDVLGAPAGNPTADLSNFVGLGRHGPSLGGAVVGVADVVEVLGAPQLGGEVVDECGFVVLRGIVVGLFGRMRRQANDDLVTAG